MAYLDPGSGSFILQLLIAAIVGSFVVFRGYIAKIGKYIRGIFSREETEEESE